MDLAEFVRDLLVLVAGATAMIHLSLVAFSWFRRSVQEV